MVSMGLRQQVEEANWILEDEVNRQVAEIMEAAEVDEECTRESTRKATPKSETWNFSMPFAGVRYYSYD